MDEFQKLADYRAIQFDTRPPSSTKFSKDFKLVDALWGTGVYSPKTRDSWINVTELFRPHVKDNGLRLSPEESIAAVSSVRDPYPNVAKTLLIRFQYQGKEQIAQYPALRDKIALGAVEVKK